MQPIEVFKQKQYICFSNPKKYVDSVIRKTKKDLINCYSGYLAESDDTFQISFTYTYVLKTGIVDYRVFKYKKAEYHRYQGVYISLLIEIV